MSLINDALQRAKQQTTQPTPMPNLPLRPMEPVQVEKKGSAMTFSIVAIVLIVAVAVISGWYQRSRISKTQVQSVAPTPAPESMAAAIPTVVPTPVKVVEPQPTTEIKSLAPTTEATNSVPIIESPKPTPIKLQAILFNTTRPSAIINGKTVYVGNRFGEYRVASITQTRATLVSSTATNVLSFEE